MSNQDLIRAYFDAVEQRVSPEELGSFFHPDVVQEEFPNRVLARGATRDLQALMEASARGRNVVASERYEIINSVSEGSKVALEVQWSAILLIPVGTLKVGDTMKARLGVFFQIEEGKIKRQGNYDCFDPF